MTRQDSTRKHWELAAAKIGCEAAACDTQYVELRVLEYTPNFVLTVALAINCSLDMNNHQYA